MLYDKKYFQGRRSFFYSMGGYRDVGLYFDRLARWFRPHAPSGPLLDVGCACGFLLSRFNDGRTLCGCDVSQWAIDEATRRLPKARFAVIDDDGRLPYPDGQFRTVLCTDVLEHVAGEAQTRMLSEFARVLAPGGQVCITTPNLNRFRRWVYRRADRMEAHVGMRHLRDWRREFGRHGLGITRHWTYLHAFLPGRFGSPWLPECALVARRGEAARD
ncbi:MAG TPA: methyltransferase domain-containing protein [Phycisphaerae bacterium]|nr:methyltransferase domain-containing protein [Phycisphaerae bacterium]